MRLFLFFSFFEKTTHFNEKLYLGFMRRGISLYCLSHIFRKEFALKFIPNHLLTPCIVTIVLTM
jgi:hypothetical protein